MAIAAAIAFNVSLNKNNSEICSLSLVNVEKANAGIGEWWNRLDWDCVEINCGFDYRTHAAWAGEGNGSEPHTWCCTGCKN